MLPDRETEFASQEFAALETINSRLIGLYERLNKDGYIDGRNRKKVVGFSLSGEELQQAGLAPELAGYLLGGKDNAEFEFFITDQGYMPYAFIRNKETNLPLTFQKKTPFLQIAPPGEDYPDWYKNGYEYLRQYWERRLEDMAAGSQASNALLGIIEEAATKHAYL